MPANEETVKQAVVKAVTQTFEAMTFTPVAWVEKIDTEAILPKPEEPEIPEMQETDEGPEAMAIHHPEPPTVYRATIHLKDPSQAEFSMIITPQMAISTTINLYGWMEETPPPENLVQDALSELINTIAGNIMSTLLHEAGTFTLSLPNLETISDLSLEDCHAFNFQTVDNFFFLLTIGGNPLP